mgnify:CR=1 FL=1|tara:strand:- start:23161 stop:23997 length:837 start_codon:yes stop_codon:yes gene_type:complete
MSVTDIALVASSAGNGASPASQDYNFIIERDRDVDIYCKVDGVAYTNFTIAAGVLTTGTFLLTTETLTIYRSTPRDQIQTWPSNTTPAAEDIEQAADKLTYIVQELEEESNRAATTPIEGPGFANDTVILVDAAGNFISMTVAEFLVWLGISVTVGGNPFDQDLNTTDDVEFAEVLCPSYKYNAAHFVAETTTSRTLTDADSGLTILCSNGSAVTITVGSALETNFWCNIVQIGAGVVTLDDDSGATTLNTAGDLFTAGQFTSLNMANYGTTDTYLVQ